MASKKLLLILNPTSGRAKIGTHLLKIIEIFSNADYKVTVYPTKCRGDATLKIAALSDNEFDLIVVCGGDGTLGEAVTGIMQGKINCKLGYIPSGTLNEWSSGLKISRNPLEAAEDIVNGQCIPLDIGKFGDRYFCYTASFGAFTEASYSAPQEIKNVLGQAAYVIEGIKSLNNIKPISLEFLIDGKEVKGDFLFGAISNSMSVGGIVKFDNSLVKLNDGLFEVLLIRNPDNILKFQPLIDGILKKDLKREGIELYHAKEIIIKNSENTPWTLDGEFQEGAKEICAGNIHAGVNFVIPKNQ